MDNRQDQVIDQLGKAVQSMEQQMAAPTLILNQISHLHQKTDKILDSHIEMVKLQAGHSEQLAEHMRRTRIMESELAPLKKSVSQAEGALKLLGLVSIVLAIVAAAVNLLKD